jgi:hypothetical protein
VVHGELTLVLAEGDIVSINVYGGLQTGQQGIQCTAPHCMTTERMEAWTHPAAVQCHATPLGLLLAGTRHLQMPKGQSAPLLSLSSVLSPLLPASMAMRCKAYAMCQAVHPP